MLDVWDIDSRTLLDMGRPEEALAALKRTVDIAPEAARAPYLVEVANLCLQLGKWEEGAKHAEALRALGDPAAYDIAARAALGKGDLAAAEAAARRGLESSTGKARVRAALVLGRIAVQKGDLASARAYADEAQKASEGDKVPQSGLHMLRGDVLARAGQQSRSREGVPRGDSALPGPPRRPGRAREPLRCGGTARRRAADADSPRRAPADAGGVPPRDEDVPRHRGPAGRGGDAPRGAQAFPERPSLRLLKGHPIRFGGDPAIHAY